MPSSGLKSIRQTHGSLTFIKANTHTYRIKIKGKIVRFPVDAYLKVRESAYPHTNAEGGNV